MEMTNSGEMTLIQARVTTADGGPSEAILAGPSAIEALLALLDADVPVVSAILMGGGVGSDTVAVCEQDGVMHAYVFVNAPDEAKAFTMARTFDKTLRAAVAPWGACFLTADYFLGPTLGPSEQP